MSQIVQTTATLPWWKIPVFSIYGNPLRPQDIALVFIVFFVGLWFARSFKRFVIGKSSDVLKISKESKILIGNFGKYIIVLITLLVTLSTLGINLTSLAVVAGALSVGIGFGLQNIVNNTVSGIILMMEKSVCIGDIIEMSNGLVGRIDEIRLRSNLLKTFDNIEIIIPNGDLIQNQVVNRTLSDGIRRLKVPFGVAYGTDFEFVRKTILEELKQSELSYYEDEDKKSNVWMSGMGPSSVDLELIVYVDNKEKGIIPLQTDFLVLIYQALYKAGITIPFPQIDVHMKSD